MFANDLVSQLGQFGMGAGLGGLYDGKAALAEEDIDLRQVRPGGQQQLLAILYGLCLAQLDLGLSELFAYSFHLAFKLGRHIGGLLLLAGPEIGVEPLLDGQEHLVVEGVALRGVLHGRRRLVP